MKEEKMAKKTIEEKAAAFDKVKESNRKSAAKYKAKLASAGIIQKNVLMPKLFARYSNNLEDLENNNATLYADYDAVGIYVADKKAYNEKILQEKMIPFLEERILKIVNQQGEIEEKKFFILEYSKQSEVFSLDELKQQAEEDMKNYPEWF